MQNGFQALRPTLAMSKWVNLVDKGHDAEWREAFLALEEWGGDNVPFPAAAYRTGVDASKTLLPSWARVDANTGAHALRPKRTTASVSDTTKSRICMLRLLSEHGRSTREPLARPYGN